MSRQRHIFRKTLGRFACGIAGMYGGSGEEIEDVDLLGMWAEYETAATDEWSDAHPDQCRNYHEEDEPCFGEEE